MDLRPVSAASVFLPAFLKTEAKLLPIAVAGAGSSSQTEVAAVKLLSVDLRSFEREEGRSEPMAPWTEAFELPMLSRPEKRPLPALPESESLSDEGEKEISPCSLIGVMLPAEPGARRRSIPARTKLLTAFLRWRVAKFLLPSN